MSKNVQVKNWAGDLTLDSGKVYSDATQIPDNVPPTVPGNPQATPTGTDSISVTWIASTDASGIQLYEIDRAPDSNGAPGTFALLSAAIPGNATSYDDTGLTDNTRYHYRLRAKDNKNNTSTNSATCTAKTNTAGTGGVWQLAAGHFTPAKRQMTVVYPRPDSETNVNDRHRWAYYDGTNAIQYFIPIGIDGGSDPMHFELITGPAGMTVGQNYGDTDHMVVKWTPSGNVTNSPVLVRVTDQELNTIDVSWTVSTSSSTSRFIFINSSTGLNTNSGAIGSPKLNTRGWYQDDPALTTFSGVIVYYRAGTHNWYLDPNTGNPGNGDFIDLNKPVAHLGYPGESVTFDFTTCKILPNGACSGLFFDNVTFDNPRPLKARHFIYWQFGCHLAVNGASRNTFSRVTIAKFYPSDRVSNEAFTDVNYQGTAYEWIQIGATSEYYVQLPGNVQPFLQDQSGAVTAVQENGVAMTLGTIGSLTPGQYAFYTPAGWTANTLAVRLVDSTDPDTKANNYITVTYNDTVGENAAPFWAFSSGIGNLTQIQTRRRKYWLFHKCTYSNSVVVDLVSGKTYEEDANGRPFFLVSHGDTIVGQYNTYRNCTGFRGTLGRFKGIGSTLTHKFADAFDITSPTQGIAAEYNDESAALYACKNQTVCWSKIRDGSNTGSVPVLKFGATADLTADHGPYHSYRNTIVKVSPGLNRPAYRYAPIPNLPTIDGDLIFTDDTDGWFLTSGQTIPATATGYVRLATSTVATHLNTSTGEVLNGSPYYGINGSTVA